MSEHANVARLVWFNKNAELNRQQQGGQQQQQFPTGTGWQQLTQQQQAGARLQELNPQQ